MLITTASGKTYDAMLCSEIPRLGWAEIRLQGVSLVEAATVFGNAEETARIIRDGATLEGYVLNAIRMESGYVRIDLTKGANT